MARGLTAVEDEAHAFDGNLTPRQATLCRHS
jgi:hypothetical protein